MMELFRDVVSVFRKRKEMKEKIAEIENGFVKIDVQWFRGLSPQEMLNVYANHDYIQTQLLEQEYKEYKQGIINKWKRR